MAEAYTISDVKAALAQPRAAVSRKLRDGNLRRQRRRARAQAEQELIRGAVSAGFLSPFLMMLGPIIWGVMKPILLKAIREMVNEIIDQLEGLE